MSPERTARGAALPFLCLARANAARLHELAEKALAKLPASARAARERAGSNHAWLRELAEKAQAELDARKQGGA